MNNCCNEKPKEKLVIGIDFGTSNCLISYIEDKQKIKFIQQKQGDNLIPSEILFSSSGVKFGHEINQDEKNQSIKSIKRIVGLTLSDVLKIKNDLPFEINIDDSTEENVLIVHENSSYSVEKIVLEMFLCLKKIILNNNFKNTEIHSVITIPAYFDEKARTIIKRLASNAGFIVLRLISEPTAAAISYSDTQNCDILTNNKSYLVYDLGGGTFDISIIKKYENNFFRVLSIGGNKFLGGDDFDMNIAKALKDKKNAKNANQEELKILAKKIKENFESTEYFTKDELKSLVKPLIEKTIDIMDKTIKTYEKEFEDDSLDTIILVGGSTRMKFLQEILSDKYKTLNKHNPDEIVSIGAALHGWNITQKTKNHTLIDAVGISFGLEVEGGGVEKFIEKNTPIPVSKTQVFTTQIHNQNQLRLSICQGENEIFHKNTLLGQFCLKNLPQEPAGKPQIEITFSIDADGILSVSAKEISTNQIIFSEFGRV